MVLIPKVTGSSSLSNFRPITLIHGIYKIIAKLLSFCLRAILPFLISANQFAFVKGRNIHKFSFLASEAIHDLHYRCRFCLVLKLDFHKAFITVL